MMEVIMYNPAFAEPSGSPFCVKAGAMLQLAGLEWRPDYQMDPRKSPKGKFPVLRDGSELIADSSTIRDYIEKKYDVDFDEGLTPQQRAQSLALIRMNEEHLYFAIVADRWVNEANWAHVRQQYFGHIPGIMRGFITSSVRKQAIGALKGHGMGRHDEAEIFERASRDVAAIKTTLGDQPFLFGDKPTGADLSIVPMLRAAAAGPTPTPIRDLIRNDEVLMAYCDRGKQALYPPE